MPELGQAKVFSKLDAKKGFWQLKLSEKSSKLTTFWTPFGRYRWNVLPFGLSSTPEIFQMKMYEITHDLEGVEVLVDDFLVYGKGHTMQEAIRDHNKNLENLLSRLKKNSCKLNRDKLILCQTTVKFYGHILTNEGLKADDSKTTAIRNYQVPKNN